MPTTSFRLASSQIKKKYIFGQVVCGTFWYKITLSTLFILCGGIFHKCMMALDLIGTFS